MVRDTCMQTDRGTYDYHDEKKPLDNDLILF